MEGPAAFPRAVRAQGTVTMRRCGKLDAILLGAALLPVAAAAGCQFWPLVSSMSFSPDGRDLAVAAAKEEPSGQGKNGAIERLVFRLWVISDRRKARVVEGMPKAGGGQYALFAPAYSPDGRELCYLRLGPIPREPTTRPAKPASGPPSLALVIRDAKTDAVLCTIPIALPPRPPRAAGKLPPGRPGREHADAPDQESSHDAPVCAPIEPPLSYARYSPCGKRIFLCFAGLAMAIERSTGRVSVLSDNAWRMRLSPDGRTLATLGFGDCDQAILKLVPTDGTPAGHLQIASKEVRDIAWKDNRTLLVLRVRDDPPGDPDGGSANE